MRRLITLISAGRNRTIVIRRELPRTRNASSGARPYRIKGRRVLLAVSPSPATGAAAKRYKSLFSGGLPLRLWFGFDGDGPGEAQQFPGNGGDDLWVVFAGRCEFLVAGTQAPLPFRVNFFFFFLETFCPFKKNPAAPGFVLIAPARSPHPPPQMRIAGFGNPASLDTIAAGIFTRDQA